MKILRKNRKSKKHDAVYRKLYKKLETARKKGLRVSFALPYANGNKFHKELHKNANNLPKSAITAFIRRYNIKLRRVQRKKKVYKTTYLQRIMKWHSSLREGLIKSKIDSPTYDFKWGRFLPSRRLNVDQVPMAFAIDKTKTYNLNLNEEITEHG